MDIEQMRDRLAELTTLMRSLSTAPDGAAGWDMTTDDKLCFDKADAEATQLRAKLGDVDRRLDVIHRSVAAGAVLGGDDADNNRGGYDVPNINRGGDPYDQDTIRIGASASDLRARVETGLERDTVTPDDVKEAAMATLQQVDGDRRSLALRCLATGGEHYRSAFAKLMSGADRLWSEAERMAVARAQSLTDADGGFAVPFTLDSTIVLTNASAINPIRRLARVVQTTTNSWNGVTSAGATASWDPEGTEVSDDSITLAQPSIPVHKAQSFIPFSVEVGGDWRSIDADLRMVLADARDNLEATAHVKGTGVDQPTGIEVELAGGASEIAPATVETFAVADLKELQRLLPARHRMMNPTWVGNIGTANDIRSFDTAGSGDLWVGLGAGTPERLLGWSWAEASIVDDSPDINVGVTEDNFIVFVGNWSRYVIVDRVGMNVELVPHLFGTNRRPTGQRGLYAWWRTGAESIDDNAFRMLNVATTL